MMIVYAVFKEGVYRHECHGIFTTETRARFAAENASEADRDDYHSYQVVPFTLNHDNAGEEEPTVLSSCKDQPTVRPKND